MQFIIRSFAGSNPLLEKLFLEWENCFVNRQELGSRAAEFIWGRKVEGVVSAVLPSAVANSSRYVVTTLEEVLDTHVPAVESHGIFYYSFTYHPPLERGSRISRRVRVVRPWIDGKTVYFGI